MVGYQWNIFWANLNPIREYEQSGIRPVVVISVEEVNDYLPVVTIIPLTSMKQGRNIYPTEVFLEKGETELEKDSIAMSYHIRAISKERLKEKCGRISSNYIKEKIKSAIKIYLDF